MQSTKHTCLTAAAGAGTLYRRVQSSWHAYGSGTGGSHRRGDEVPCAILILCVPDRQAARRWPASGRPASARYGCAASAPPARLAQGHRRRTLNRGTLALVRYCSTLWPNKQRVECRVGKEQQGPVEDTALRTSSHRHRRRRGRLPGPRPRPAPATATATATALPLPCAAHSCHPHLPIHPGASAGFSIA